ncbi:FAD-dependent oxidoreductase [Candidatus Sulfurimonas baltica]|uniref:FAD-dependent oxidoreductase n=1 Tax=Candidatus Sulfurimonas baltica TaxID=2740404 RepID=A0A7S7LVB3_9BACT|nr:FAD-dependent oxidoreductase [Candidatus Sulfurimonas baltica]QOY52157.1 FAD-dependent oxidoreductase [Candidatus Sulfurimonas baltica]
MRSDVVIIGAGGAGLVSAIHAHESGAKVIVLTKEYPTRSQTCMAQGGINAALSNVGEDSVEAHIQNTLKSAHSIADESAVKFLCEEAIGAVEWLDSIGVPFSRTKDGKIAQRTLGGASAPRACYAQDYTGLKILHTLYDRCLSLGIEILDERYLLEFITNKSENKLSVCGVSVLNKRSGEVEIYESSSVIVATGGYSRIFHKHTTNSSSSTGDGIASALRAGARLSDMEFIQFHPTALKNSSILISESARGAGGYLLNSKLERFTNELAPRDEVARAIYDEMQKGEDVFLDIRHLGEKFIDEELPQERKLAKLYENIDPVSDLVPIKPVAHYTMGGIEVDSESMTNVMGLFAVGECANHKVHGANRLGGNSLLELIVFGKQAGNNAASYANNVKAYENLSLHVEAQSEILQNIRNATCRVSFYEKHKLIGDIFYKNVGIKRDKKELIFALDEVYKIKDELPLMGVDDKSKIYNSNLIEFLEFKNMLQLCEMVLICAIARDESRGAHFRVDAPNENDVMFKAHSIVDDNTRVSYEN